MAATRKLQGEIERCLKKVAEGVETFEDIWQKVHNATNSNQKEKYEADLKKEIKKLQRLRDQIKSWITSAEIKDKSTLIDHRKLIETQMERFKIVERETKTKAYSKEGLGAAQKLDPAQKERDDMSLWLTTTIDALNIQLDTLESEVESMTANKKKRIDKEKQDRIDELKFRLDKHRYHIRKLETLLRMLDNMSVEVNQIRNVKEDIEYYMCSCRDPDFQDNDYIYDDIIGIDDVELGDQQVTLPSTTDSNDGGSPTSLVSNSPSLPLVPLSTSSPPPPVRPASSSSSSLPSSLNNNSALGNNPNNNSSSESSSEEGRKRVSSGSAGVISSKQQALEESLSTSKPVRPTAVRATNSNPTPLASGMNSQHSGTTKLSNAIPSKSLPGSSAHTTPNNSSPSSGLLTNQVIAGNFASVAASSTCTNGTTSQGVGKSSSVPTSVTPAPAGVLVQQQQQQQMSQAQQQNVEQQLQQSQSQQMQQQSQQQLHQQQQSLQQQLGAQMSTSPTAPVTNVGPQMQLAKGGSNSYAVTSSSPSPLSVSSVPSPQPLAPGPGSVIGFSMLRPGPLQQQQQQPTQTSQQQTQQLPTPVLISPLTSIKAVGAQNSSINPTTTLPIVNGPLMSKVPDGMSSLKVIAQQVIDRAGLEVPFAEPDRGIYDTGSVSPPTDTVNMLKAHQQAVSSVAQLAANTSASMVSLSTATAVSALTSNVARNSPPHTAEAHIPPLLGVAPLGPVPLQKEHQFQLQMLEAAYYHMPHPSDSEKLRPYLPRNPCVLPSYYPQALLLHSDTVEFFQRLATESLFFIFYYMEGTKAQYLAAKALKKQSWRFHTKYMMWFQRHEEPKHINEEYEQGTYIYFDYEKWGQRKKEGFTFEYKYLEDRELN